MSADNDTGLAVSEGVPENSPGTDDSLAGVLESSFNAIAERDSGTSDEGSSAEGTTTSTESPESTQSAADQGTADAASAEASTAEGTAAGDASASIEAPAHWSAADREMFGKVAPDAQKWLLDRSKAMEAAHTRRSQEIAPMRQLAERWNPYFQQLGASAPQAIDLLLQTEYQLRTGSQEKKLEVIRDLIRDYGIQAPAGETDGGTEQGARDPRVDQLTEQLQQMQQGWQQQQQTTVQQQQAMQQQAMGRAQAALQAFANQKGADGKLAHPHFGEVQDEMTRLAQADLAAGVQPDLNSLYERAIWANGTTRSQLLAAQQSQEAERRRQEAEKAKRAGGQISGAGAPATEQPKGLRETLEAAWDRQSAAA